MIRFEDILDTSPLSLKKLNDQLRALWNKTMNVGNKDILDNAVSEEKVTDGAITTNKIADAAITNAKIDNLSVTSAKIADAAITNAKIASLDAGKITTGTLNANNVSIANNVVQIGASGIWVDGGNYSVRDKGLDTSLQQWPNLIPDHSFECLPRTGAEDGTYHDYAIGNLSGNYFEWNKWGNPRLLSARASGIVPEALFGLQAAVVNYSNWLYVYVPVTPNTTYTLSGFATRGYRSSTCTPRLFIQYYDEELTAGTKYFKTFPALTSIFNWTRLKITFTTPSTATYVRLVPYAADANWVCWDGIQLVEGAQPVLYEPEENLWRHMFGVAGLQGNPEHIIESGSNSNGSYVKFGDGTMICWVRMSVTDQAINRAYGSLFIGTRKWRFPAAFLNPPTVTCSEFRWGTGASWGGVSAATYSYAILRGYDVVSRASGTTCTIAATAIGVW